MEFAEFIRTPRVEKVTLYRANTPPLEGTLCVTGHHLILSRRQDDDEEELWVTSCAVFLDTFSHLWASAAASQHRQFRKKAHRLSGHFDAEVQGLSHHASGNPEY